MHPSAAERSMIRSVIGIKTYAGSCSDTFDMLVEPDNVVRPGGQIGVALDHLRHSKAADRERLDRFPHSTGLFIRPSELCLDQGEVAPAARVDGVAKRQVVADGTEAS